VTTSKVVTPQSYWRCGSCGELWNTARTEDERPKVAHWGYHR